MEGFVIVLSFVVFCMLCSSISSHRHENEIVTALIVCRVEPKAFGLAGYDVVFRTVEGRYFEYGIGSHVSINDLSWVVKEKVKMKRLNIKTNKGG